MFFSAVKLDILTWGRYRFDLHEPLQPASCRHSMNCSLIHFRVGFKERDGEVAPWCTIILRAAPDLVKEYVPEQTNYDNVTPFFITWDLWHCPLSIDQ